MIVDTHIHIVSEDEAKYPRNVEPHAVAWIRDMPVSGESLLGHMAEAGVDRAIIVQAFGVYQFDNSYAADASAAHRDRYASVCVVDPLLPDAPDRLSYWVTERGMRGIRLFTSTQPEGTWLDDPATFPLWERCAALGIPVTVQVMARQLHKLRPVLERFPGLPVAVDHMGAPALDDGPPYEAAKPMWDLAEYPNVHLKFSSMSIYQSNEGKSSAAEFFPRLVERFGPQRLLWGSNFPNTYDRGLKEQLAMARDVMAFLSPAEQEMVFGGTALTFWPELR